MTSSFLNDLKMIRRASPMFPGERFPHLFSLIAGYDAQDDREDWKVLRAVREVGTKRFRLGIGFHLFNNESLYAKQI